MDSNSIQNHKENPGDSEEIVETNNPAGEDEKEKSEDAGVLTAREKPETEEKLEDAESAVEIENREPEEGPNDEISGESATDQIDSSIEGESTIEKIQRRRRERLWRFVLLPLFTIIAILLFISSRAGIIDIPPLISGSVGIILILITLHFGGFIGSKWTAIIATAIAMVPQFYVRSSYNLYFNLSVKYGTYPGDLWYCWNHYLVKGWAYPREYPSGIQMIFKFIFQAKPKTWIYEDYIIYISIFLGLFALLITYILYSEVQATHKKTAKVWMFWILAPTFLWYGLLNVDLISIFTVVIAYYLFVDEEYYLSSAMLALGTAMKVFPFFVAPLLFFQCPAKEYSEEALARIREFFNLKLRFLPSSLVNFIYGFLSSKRGFSRLLVKYRIRLGCVLVFILIWLAFNVPFMVTDWSAWKYPYQWQIKHNYAKSPKDGSYFWLIHNFLNYAQNKIEKNIPHSGILWRLHKKVGDYKFQMGKISLLLFAALYFWFLRKKWDLPFARRCAGIILLFLLTDRIYSPQYNLYLLPFLVLVDYKFGSTLDKILFYGAFYVAELINIGQVMFLFRIRELYVFPIKMPFSMPEIVDIPVLFQGLVLLKYILLLYIFYVNCTAPVNPDYVNWKDGSGKIDRDGNLLVEATEASLEKAGQTP